MVQPIDGSSDDDFLADLSKLPDRVWADLEFRPIALAVLPEPAPEG